MAWDYDTSLARARAKFEETDGLTVSDVVRETDFDKITLTGPRRLSGTHLYVDVSNFNTRLREGTTEQGEMLRLLHIWNREVSRIAKDLEVAKVHFQGPRLHGVAYRPVSDESAMAAKAVLLAWAARHTISVFNDVFSLADRPWKVSAGADHGVVIATKNGVGGDRELLFLGTAANQAAHILQETGVRISAEVADLLPDSFDDHVNPSGQHYLVTLTVEQAEEQIAASGWTWTLDGSRKRLNEAADTFPADCAKITSPQKAIDKKSLSLSDTKRVTGASVFADVDGFTAYIEEAMASDPDLVDAVRAFHVIRAEGRNTAVVDCKALRIQYQGDRMQALAYQPIGDDATIALNAVTLAAALTSVANEVVPEVVVADAAKPLAIGLALGEVLVSKIGEHNNRDMIVIGSSVAEAANIQQRLDGGQIGLDVAAYDLLPEWIQEEFTWSSSAQAYTATNLTYDALLDLAPTEESASAVKSALLGLAAGVGVGAAAVAYAATRPRSVESPLRPWSRD